MMQVIFLEGYLALFLPFFRGCSGIFCNFIGDMKLNKINIYNFKCFEDVSIELYPRLNVLMGNNGTGKSSLLEAFRILIVSLYLGYDKYENKIAMPGIVKDDIRLRNIEDSLEPQIPAYVYAKVNCLIIICRKTVGLYAGRGLWKHLVEVQRLVMPRIYSRHHQRFNYPCVRGWGKTSITNY